MMTAIAIFAPELRPLEELELDPEALSAEGVAEAFEAVVGELIVAVAVLVLSEE